MAMDECGKQAWDGTGDSWESVRDEQVSAHDKHMAGLADARPTWKT